MKKFFPWVFLLAGTLVYAQMPPEIIKWTNDNSGTVMYGMGISTLTDDFNAFLEASALGLENLAANLDIQSYFISERTKTYGPYRNTRRATYVVIYLSKEDWKICKEEKENMESSFSGLNVKDILNRMDAMLDEANN